MQAGSGEPGGEAMGCADKDDCEFTVRIRDVPGYTTGNATIDVRPTLKAGGNIESSGIADPNGTDIKFVLNGHVLNKLQLHFPTGAGAEAPVCVVADPTTAKDCDDLTDQFPSKSWWIIGPVKAKTFTLHVPPLDDGQHFKYFLVLKGPGTSRVIIDPKIGCCEVSHSFVPRVSDWLGPAAGIAVLLVAVGGVAMILRRR